MKHIVWKLYSNFEKEEKWLNEMSAKGLALTDYSWCRYVFEEAPKGEYIYRIELLENLPTNPESIAYIKFLEDAGVECVATYMRWVFFRKKAKDGTFDLYSDIDSKIKHYKRVLKLWLILALAELTIGFSNIQLGLLFSEKRLGPNAFLGLPLFIFGIVILFSLAMPLMKKIKRLKKEKQIRE